MSASRISLLAVLSALLGGGVAVGVASVAGVGDSSSTTTVIRESAAASPQTVSRDGGLSARDIYRQAAPGVVFITSRVSRSTTSLFGTPQSQSGVATGSGFVIDKRGTILTNAHVIDNATKVTVRFGDSREITAKVLGRDRTTDLAALQVKAGDIKLLPLPLGSSTDVQVGDPVVAIGNPFGLDRTLTTGVVSAKQRHIKGLVDFAVDNVIQTDAAINPGNSGGPLIDAEGKVIGINSQIESGSSAGSSAGNVGVGFAIPIDTAIKLLPDLRKGEITTGYLGLVATPVDDSMEGLNLSVKRGALVQSVSPGAPAAKAGIKGGSIPARVAGQDITIGGDIIVRVDDKPITSAEDLTSYIQGKHAGQTVKVVVVRSGKKQTFSVQLTKRPQVSTQQSATTAP